MNKRFLEEAARIEAMWRRRDFILNIPVPITGVLLEGQRLANEIFVGEDEEIESFDWLEEGF